MAESLADLARHPQAASQPAILKNRFFDVGLVEITGTGLWAPGYVDAHFEALETALATIRVKHGLARVLVNLARAPAQSAATADRIAFWTGRIYRPEDPVAILVDAEALRDQMKRRVMIATFEVFISEVAGRLWLYAE